MPRLSETTGQQGAGQGSGRDAAEPTSTGEAPPRRPRSTRARRARPPRRVALRALLGSAVAGPVVGLLWWLVAPGGLRPPGDGYLDLLQAAGDADAAFAVVCLLAGTVAGVVWVVLRDEVHDERAVARLVGLLVGGLVGAGLAWATALLLQVLVPTPAGDVPADVVAGLTAPRATVAVVAGALLWPTATGVLVTVDTLRELAWQAWSRTDR